MIKCEQCHGLKGWNCVCEGSKITIEGLGGYSINLTPLHFIQTVTLAAKGLTDEQMRELILTLQKSLCNR